MWSLPENAKLARFLGQNPHEMARFWMVLVGF
jgi:hypothetical protein